jgi:large subunit ribosomal protein L10
MMEGSVDRAGKEQLVAALHRTFAESSAVVVTHYIGLTVAELGDLRAKMREAGAGLKVTKNRLAKLALAGTPYEQLDGLFTGPTAIAYAADPVAPAKVVAAYAKTNPKLVVIGGGLGRQVLDEEAVKALASLPSLAELRARLLGVLSAPASRLVGVLQAPAGQVARVLQARAEAAAEGTAGAGSEAA